MSLEATIQENTQAVKALTALLSRSGGALPVPAPSAPTTPPRSASAALLSPTPQAPEQQAPKALDYKEVAAQIMKVTVEKGREQALALYQRFGLKHHLNEAREEQWPDIMKMAKRILEEGYDPRDAEPIAETEEMATA